MSTIVYDDYFAIRGGGERLVLDLACRLGAELVYGCRTEETYEATQFPGDNRNLDPGAQSTIADLSSL